jgi:hypothetical protein
MKNLLLGADVDDLCAQRFEARREPLKIDWLVVVDGPVRHRAAYRLNHVHLFLIFIAPAHPLVR